MNREIQAGDLQTGPADGNMAVPLYETDFVYILEDGSMGKFRNGQIAITGDEQEVIRDGCMPVRCTDLSKEEQEELKRNILQFE